jgi:hypothetical protein
MSDSTKQTSLQNVCQKSIHKLSSPESILRSLEAILCNNHLESLERNMKYFDAELRHHN